MRKKVEKTNIKKIIMFFVVICIFIFSIVNFSNGNVHAATEFKLVYNGKTINYTGAQVIYKFNSKNVDMKETPGIVINNVAFASYVDVFEKSLGAVCSYNSKTKKITITKYDKTIILKLNSKKAKINGKIITLSEAPRKVKYKTVEETKILVPTRVVAEALGYVYKWDSSNAAVTISYNGWEEYYIDGKWTKYTGTTGKVTYDEKNISVTSMPAIIKDHVVLVQAKKVFYKTMGVDYTYSSNGKDKILVLKKNDVTLQFTIGSKIAQVNGTNVTMSTEARVIKNKRNGKSYVMIPAKFAVTNLGYSYTWNASQKTVEIKTRTAKTYFSWNSTNVIENPESPYTNFIKSVVSATDGSDDTLCIEGVSEISAEISFNEDKSIIYIYISNALTDIADLTETISDNGSKIKSVGIAETKEGGIRFTLKVTAGAEYYVSSIGECYTIHFVSSDITEAYELSFMRPEKVEVSAIKGVDKYWSKKFVIVIPGDYVEFYKKNIIKKNNSVIKSANVALNSSGNTMIIVETTKLQGYRIDYSNDQILVKIDEPKNIYRNIVVLDPGHGGVDPGAIGNNVNEKDVVYSILYTYAKKYFNAENSKVKAYWTRVSDKKIELNDRAAFAAAVGADCFISLHMNSAASNASGTEVYYSASNNSKTASGLTSAKLASYFEKNIVSSFSMNSRGVKTAQFVVIKKNTVPAILIELGFISNESDREKFTNVTYQKKAAKLFYNLTVDIFKKYPTGR